MAIDKNDYLDVDGNYDLKKALIDELIDGIDTLTNQAGVKIITDWNDTPDIDGVVVLYSNYPSQNNPQNGDPNARYIGLQMKYGNFCVQIASRINSSITLVWIRHSQSGLDSFYNWRELQKV